MSEKTRTINIFKIIMLTHVIVIFLICELDHPSNYEKDIPFEDRNSHETHLKKHKRKIILDSNAFDTSPVKLHFLTEKRTIDIKIWKKQIYCPLLRQIIEQTRNDKKRVKYFETRVVKFLKLFSETVEEQSPYHL